MKKFLFIMVSVFVVVLNICIENKGVLCSKFSSNYNIYDFVFFDESECFKIEGDLDDVINILGVEIHNSFVIDDHVIVEGFVDGLSDSVVINGFRVNVQLSGCDGVVIVGIPLIENSF